MRYNKKPLTVDEQIDRLEQRGLNFSDRKQAKNYLQNISYYRLRAYTYPFQDNKDPEADHEFLRDDIDFNDIIDLYVFDRLLRSFVFNELEKIEVAIRTQLSLVYSNMSKDPFWYLDKQWFSNASDEDFNCLMEDVTNDVNRSNEDFIKHYKKTYDSPEMPPTWMSLEVVSFGTLSRMYKMLDKSPEKRQISLAFGIGNVDYFANWLHAFSNLRNCCAHHSRIWNRRFIVHMLFPKNTTQPFLTTERAQKIRQNKLFALVTAIKYIADILSPGNSFKDNLKKLLNDRHQLLRLKEMGFPMDWESLPVWKN